MLGSRSRIYEQTISLRFLGIIFRFPYAMFTYLTGFKSLLLKGRRSKSVSRGDCGKLKRLLSQLRPIIRPLAMPSLHDLAHDGVLCTFRNTVDQAKTGASGVVCQGKRHGLSIAYKITPLWVTLLQPARAAVLQVV
jgi:hypothetical protein